MISCAKADTPSVRGVVDRTLIGRAEGGVINLRADHPAAGFEGVRQQLLIARVRQLERMDLATQQEPLRWSLRPDLEDVLRTMGERGDIIKTMHRDGRAKLERSPHLYTIHGRDAQPVVGRVVTRGLAGDDSDQRYLVVATVPIERQTGVEGATWLDRQLVRELNHERAAGGFGADVYQALVRRQQWLIEQGLMKRDGTDVVFRNDLLKVLTQRELRQAGRGLAAKLDKTFIEPFPGLRVQGVYRQAVDLASGRFAVIERELDFTLAPRRPALERHLGRAVSGTPQGDDFDWTFGLGRGGTAR